MPQRYKTDLHIHTVLSACADLSMGPRDIVNMALQQRLDIIAITDHNSAENVRAVMEAAAESSLTVIPGMEVYVREEAHLICLFPDIDRVLNFQDFVYDNLPDGEYDASMFGLQLVCDKDENILYENKRLLPLPLRASVQQVALEVDVRGGIIYPAHIDRKSFSILRVMGYIPSNLPIHAVEISQPLEMALKQVPFLSDTEYSIVRASDAHHLNQIGSAVTYFHMQKPDFDEMRRAIQKIDGRYISLD